MPIYGRYEVVERLHASTSVTVARARLVDGKHPVFLVKIFQPPGVSPEELRALSKTFTDRVRLQEQLGAKPDPSWAPIRHVGNLPTGVFYVVDFFPLTLQSLFAQHVQAGPHVLDSVVSGIVAGLVQLQGAFHRPHGNLKPANVLFDRKRLADARVLLTDPAPPADAKAAGAAADLRALGSIIHELVLGRPFAAGEAWPVPDGPQWEALGPAGRHWQKLCSDLLSPKPVPGATSAMEVRNALDEIEAIQRRPLWQRVPRSARVAMAACIAGVALGASGICLLDYSSRRQLADAQQQWLGPLAQGASDPVRAKRYDSDPGLRAMRTDLDAARSPAIDPQPSLSSVRPLSYFETRSRLARVQRVRDDLTAAHWQKLADTEALADKLAERGWMSASMALRSMIGDIQPTANLTAAIDHLLNTEERVRRDLPALDADWAALTNRVNELRMTSEPFFVAAGAMYESKASSAVALTDAGLTGRDAIHQQSENLQQLVDILHDGYNQKFNRARLQSEVADKFDLGHLTPADVQTWKKHLPEYAFQRDVMASAIPELNARMQQKAREVLASKPSPGAALALNDGVSQISTAMRRFEQTPFIARDITDGTFASRRKAIEAQIDALGTIAPPTVAVAPPAPAPVAPPAPTPAPVVTPPPATRAVAQVSIAVPSPTTEPLKTIAPPTTRVYASANSPIHPPPVLTPAPTPEAKPAAVKPPSPAIATQPMVAPPATPAAWIQSLPLIAGSSDVVAAYWEDWKHVLQNSSAEMSSKPELFAAMKNQTNGLHDALLDLDKTFPAPPGGLPATFTAVAVERREREIAKALSQIDSKSAHPAVPAAREAGEAYGQWEKKLVALAADFPLRGQVVRLGQRPDQKWEKAEPQFWSDPSIVALVRKDVERIRAVADLQKLSRSDLADAAASSTAIDVTLAAWELLGADSLSPLWPTRPGELEAERDLRQKIVTMAKLLQSPDEQGAINTLLDAQGIARWTRFANAVNSEQMIASANDLQPVFGDPTKLGVGLTAPARFNLSLFQARQRSRGSDDTAARQLASSIRHSATELPDHAAVTNLIDRLTTLDTPEPFADRNPGERYTLNVAGAGGGMVFQRVQGVETRPFYLATSDISVGQFISVISSHGAWDRASGFAWGVEPGKRDMRRGPRVWEWSDRPAVSMTLPLLWFTPDDDNDYLPAYRITRFNRTALSDDVGGNPLPDHPMQQIPAEAALFYAAMCQSRLPTSTEWREAYAIFERTVPMERWNLRDQTFDAQRKYVASITTTTQRWPDEAIYRPVGSTAPSGADATSRPEQDGSLFFRTVSAPGGGTFHHLVGNVAQFVCDAPEAFDAWTDKQTVEGIRNFIKAYPKSLRVIGGSALSPPELPFDKPLPLARTDQGYSDVGFRLAFTAPSRSIAERLRWVLAGQKYLWEKTEAAATTGPSEAVAR